HLSEPLLAPLLDVADQHEEERLVPAVIDLGDVDRPAERTAEIVADERIADGRKEIAGIELVVPVKIVRRTVQFVSAAPCDDVELRASAGAELGRVVAANG